MCGGQGEPAQQGLGLLVWGGHRRRAPHGWLPVRRAGKPMTDRRARLGRCGGFAGAHRPAQMPEPQRERCSLTFTLGLEPWLSLLLPRGDLPTASVIRLSVPGNLHSSALGRHPGARDPFACCLQARLCLHPPLTLKTRVFCDPALSLGKTFHSYRKTREPRRVGVPEPECSLLHGGRARAKDGTWRAGRRMS